MQHIIDHSAPPPLIQKIWIKRRVFLPLPRECLISSGANFFWDSLIFLIFWGGIKRFQISPMSTTSSSSNTSFSSTTSISSILSNNRRSTGLHRHIFSRLAIGSFRLAEYLLGQKLRVFLFVQNFFNLLRLTKHCSPLIILLKVKAWGLAKIQI